MLIIIAKIVIMTLIIIITRIMDMYREKSNTLLTRWAFTCHTLLESMFLELNAFVMSVQS